MSTLKNKTNVHKFFITTPTEQIVLQHQPKHMHENEGSSSTKGAKVQPCNTDSRITGKNALSNLIFRFNHLGDYTISVRDLERYPIVPWHQNNKSTKLSNWRTETSTGRHEIQSPDFRGVFAFPIKVTTHERSNLTTAIKSALYIQIKITNPQKARNHCRRRRTHSPKSNPLKLTTNCPWNSYLHQIPIMLEVREHIVHALNL